MDGIAGFVRAVGRDRGHFQIGRRRLLDQQGLRARAIVVLLGVALIHAIAQSIGTFGIGHDQDIVRSRKVAWRAQIGHRIEIALVTDQASRMRGTREKTIGLGIEEGIAREIDQISPRSLRRRHSEIAHVGDLIRDVEELPGRHARRNRHLCDLEIRRRRLRNRERLKLDVVAFTAELGNKIADDSAGRVGKYQEIESPRHTGRQIHRCVGRVRCALAQYTCVGKRSEFGVG